MKLIDAINNIDKSERNTTSADYEDFCNEFGIPDFGNWYDEFDERVKGYYLIRWYCTDTWVGMVVYFFDGVPVGLSTQSGRKSSKEYCFFNKDIVDKMRSFILSIRKPEETNNLYRLVDIEDEIIDDYYTVKYSDEVIEKEGFVGGEHCVVIDYFHGDIIAKNLKVKFDDGHEELISTSSFKMKIHTNKEN